MGFQTKFKPTNAYRPIDQRLTRILEKQPISTFQELGSCMKFNSKNMISTYNQLRVTLIKKQVMREIPTLLQKC